MKDDVLTAHATGISPIGLTADVAKGERMDGLEISTSGGNCPVQIEGTIDGRPFYFRARGEHWSIEIHPTATGDYLSWPNDQAAWTIVGEYGEWPDAGWMPIEQAMAIVEKSCDLWRVAQFREDRAARSAAEPPCGAGVIPNPESLDVKEAG